MTFKLAARTGLTLIELIAVLAICIILSTLALRALAGAREAVRNTTCVSNQRQIGIALAAYGSQFGALPPSANIDLINSPRNAINPFSVHTRLLPYIGEGSIFNTISFGGMPRLDAPIRNYPTPSVFKCPSESRSAKQSVNYCISIGVRAAFESFVPPHRGESWGAFASDAQPLSLFVEKGMGNLIFFAERSVGSRAASKSKPLGQVHIPFDQGEPDRDWFYIYPDGFAGGYFTPNQWTQLCVKRLEVKPPWRAELGGLWYSAEDSFINQILVPNSEIPDCGYPVYPMRGTRTARSEHLSRVNVLYGDGRVETISDGIDLQVWRDLGSR